MPPVPDLDQATGALVEIYGHRTLWADRTTTRKSTGYPPFELMIARRCVLATWQTVNPEEYELMTTTELLVARARLMEVKKEKVMSEVLRDNLTKRLSKRRDFQAAVEAREVVDLTVP